MKGQKLLLAAAIAGLAVLASACSINVERNPDGSFQATGTITEASLAQEMERDPLNESVEIDFQTGGVIVASVERVDNLGLAVNDVDFTADIAFANGELTAEVTEATFDGFPIPEQYVDAWNEELSRGLRKLAGEHPNASLESVTTSGDSMIFEWRLETDESRNN